MKIHSNNFKNQIKLMGKQQDVEIIYGNKTLTSEDIIRVTFHYQGNLLKSVMKGLEIETNKTIPIGQEIQFRYGLFVNGAYEYLDYGKYIVKEIEKQEDSNSYIIICYDKMLYSMKEYYDLQIQYPITIREYINTICNAIGVNFANNNDTFVNYNKQIPSELYLTNEGKSLDYTYRDILDELAQVTASTICINNNDELEIRYINETNDTIDEEYLKDINVNFGKKYGKINSIVLSRSAESDNVYLRDEESVEQNGLCELKIKDNQIMNFNNRDEFLPEILNKLNGTEYYINDFTSTGIMYYDLLDSYNVKIGNNTYNCLMLNEEINITQGLEELIYTEEPEITETDYTKADKTDRRINKTYIIADKINGEITSVVNKVDNITATTAKAEGKHIHLTDSANEPLVDIRLHGETSQKTRSGKNLLPITLKQTATKNGITFTSNGDGSYSLKGTSTADTQILFALPFAVQLPNSTLYCHMRNNIADNHVALLLYDGTSGASPSFSEVNRIMTTVNLTNLYMTHIGIKVVAGATVDINFKPSIELTGDVTEYEQYGESPTPEFPSEIENVEGKNLLDYTKVENTSNTTVDLIENGFNVKGRYAGKVIVNNLKKNTDYYLQYSTENIIGTVKSVIVFAGTSQTTTLMNYSNGVGGMFNTGDNTEINIWFYAGGGSNDNEVNFTNIQLEEGTLATPYAPFNSLAVKVTGKNLLKYPFYNTTKTINGITFTDNGDGSVTANGTATGQAFFVLHRDIIKSGEYVLSGCPEGGNSTTYGIYFSSPDYTDMKWDIGNSVKINLLNEGQREIVINIASGTTVNNLIFKPQLEKGETATAYEPYKEQTSYFPLSEGQKLYEGSYLADDGVHNKKKQVVFDGSNDEVWKSYTNTTVEGYVYFLPINNSKIGLSKSICSHFENIPHAWDYGLIGQYSDHPTLTNRYFVTDKPTLTEWKAWLQQNPITVEYELAEEEIVSYTAEQQEAWNQIRALTTYKNVTNISSDAYAEIAYMRDNGLDVYETKQNADLRYVQTQEKLVEQKLTSDGISNIVSDTVKRLNNNYLTAEQVNAEIGGAKDEIDIIKQNQTKVEQTAGNLQIQINTINNEGVSKVKTSMGYTFNDEGMHVNKDGAETGTIVDEAGVSVLDKTGFQDTKLLYAGYVREGDADYSDYVGQTIVASSNMIVKNYLVIPNSRFEAYENSELGGHGTGVFEI